MTQDELNNWFDQRFEERRQKEEDDHVPSMSIIATKGTMDWAYPPFILASTAAALGWDVSMFFTFYGLDLLKKNLNLSVSPMGNPAMPMKMPVGPEWLKNINMNIPNAIMGNMPGFETMATAMMKKTTEVKGIASVEELRSLCLEAEVKMLACQMTVDMFGHNQDEFMDEVDEWVGAASFLPTAQKSDVTLFI
ncbi:MAG: NADH-quinone oxidoreductase subunit F [endosymbiont of Galathealinum brachiosum]|uniref:NADH-quinone oxidoreductase subunit F n=1 Tax=endosymbiont of Galathealinum brachiosum TaxID=2200906 RepID=A0A370DLN0_9GAMM|nr:MAG: NADH-quinone oxidoreductase subunit F [endosymbiont of Galathealinum brachiosum]